MCEAHSCISGVGGNKANHSLSILVSKSLATWHKLLGSLNRKSPADIHTGQPDRQFLS